MKISMIILVTMMFMIKGFGAEASTRTLGSEYPYLCSGVLKDAVLSVLPNGVILSSGSIELSQKDIEKRISEYPEYQRDQAKQFLILF